MSMWINLFHRVSPRFSEGSAQAEPFHSTRPMAMKNIPVLVLFATLVATPFAASAKTPAPQEARAIARDAFIYGYPLVEGYKTLYKQAVDDKDPNYKAPFNAIGHSRTPATPEDKAIITPNSDTPYSYAWLDLRAEPVVISMPPVEKNRYYSAQLIDLQTFNFAYLGTRSFGNDGGDFLITGPGWKGTKPEGIKAVIPCETSLMYVLFRTQLFGPADLPAVHRIQDSYRVRPLSGWQGTTPPPAAPTVSWPALDPKMTEDATLFSYLNFLLQFCPPHPSEKTLAARFDQLGIAPGKPFDPASLDPAVSKAIREGIAEVWEIDFAAAMKRVNAGDLGSGDLFGTREFLKNNSLYRFVGAKLGIYGNSREEANYQPYFTDAEGKPMDTSKNSYQLHFAKGQLPPVNAFWSLTIYDGKNQLLVPNSLNRYLLNSTHLDSFKYDADGGLTLYISHQPPAKELENNWIPAPNGPVFGMLRLYLPQDAVFNGSWKSPKMVPSTIVQTSSVTPSVETRIGKLEFDLGLPTLPTVEKLFDEIDFQRACQAYLWALPIVNIGEWQRAHEKDFNAKDGDIVIYNNYQDKLGILTPNLTTPYIVGFANLARTGPLAIDYPAGLSAGGVLDFWQRPLCDMGQTGPDKGAGAKYLIVGPGQDAGDTQGYSVYPSPTFNVGIAYRVLETDPAKAEALMKAVRIYPYSQRANPPQNQFLTPEGKPWSQTPPDGFAYWERLAELLNQEAVAERDSFIMAMLKPLGIEKGKPFQPDDRQKKILTEAAFIGAQMAKANSFDKRFPGSLYRDDARWEILFAPGFSPDQKGENAAQLDERAAYTWEAVWTTAGMVTHTPGVGQAYLGVHRDRSGNAIDGAKHYRLRVPANPPAQQFWSVTIYDLETRRPVENSTRIVDRSSRQPDLVKNPDGSVDLFFGPEPKQGAEPNSLITVPGRAWFPLLRLYGPTQPYFDRAWPLPDLESAD
jgi:hypothetical protein